MEEMRKRTVRKEVPEHDPAYLKAREISLRSSADTVFGRSAASSYEINGDSIEMSRGIIAKHEAHLAEETDPDKQSYIRQLIAREQEYIQRREADRPESLHRSFDVLLNSLPGLIIRYANSERTDFITGKIREMFSIPEVEPELRSILGADYDGLVQLTSDYKPLLTLHVALQSGAIPDTVLYTIAKRHSERMTEREKQLAEFVAQTKREFAEAIHAAVQSDRLPKPAEMALGRLDSMRVRLYDQLLSPLSGRLGSNDSLGTINVSDTQFRPHLMPRLRKTLFHEFLHEISGTSVTVVTDEDPRWSTPSHIPRIRKTGVSVTSKDRAPVSPNTWLNEAITESLALELSGYVADEETAGAYKGSASYGEERRELDRILALGVDRSVLTDAYFENFTSEPDVRRGEHFTRMVREINRVEGPFGFNRLENEHLVRMIGEQLTDDYVYDSERHAIPRDKRVAKVLRIRIEAGVRPETQAAHDYFCLAYDWPSAYGEQPSPEEQVEALKKRLDDTINGWFGGAARYELREEVPTAVA